MMEHMGKKKPRPRRSFTREFKAEIVELCQRGDRSIGQVAKDFNLTETAVRDWIRQAEVDTGRRDELTSNEREELAALRRENRRLREDVNILKRATAGSGCPSTTPAEPRDAHAPRRSDPGTAARKSSWPRPGGPGRHAARRTDANAGRDANRPPRPR
ncbi:transposase [Planomonospora sp. ID91781]|uniref:transposase n=1 Tax=Planomonospora sp. ID91781 TaxID=2738135 RepID=UPI0018C35ECC|nr:transposase [Planomonospora sp. ID91781]MBG0825876.1 transposase [Planomonospora sp. ID91781]